MPALRPHRFRRRGATIILVAVVMPVLLGFMALAIDVGAIHSMDAETQAAVDASALAGVSAFVTADADAAIQRAREYLAPNLAGRTGSANTSTIEVGRWNESNRTFAANAARPNAIRVTATRHDAPLFFAAVFG